MGPRIMRGWHPMVIGLFGAMALLHLGTLVGLWPCAPALATVGLAALLWALFRGGDAAGSRPPAPAALRPPTTPPLSQAGAAQPLAMERRAAPRFRLAWPVVVERRGGGSHPAELQDISETGARLVTAAGLMAGARGRLIFEGLRLPVPFAVLEALPAGDARLRFDLEGLARAEFLRRLGELTDGVEPAPVPGCA
jgi:hypothetical protein